MKKVLVIDDEPMYIALYKALFRQVFGKKVELLTATTGMDGMRLALMHQPDLIMVDYLMPGMSGAEVTTKLKTDARTLQIPIILVTNADARSIRGAIYEEFRSKPIKPDMLHDIGKQYLKITCP